MSPPSATTALAAPRAEWNLPGLSIVAFGHATNDFFAAAVPFLIFYNVAHWSLPPWYQGVLGLVWYVTSSIVQPVFGYWSDRNSRWWFLPAGVALTTVAVSVLGTMPSVGWLVFTIVCGGLGSAIFHPEAGRYTAMLSGSRKAGGISIFQTGGSLGFAFGPAAIAMLLARAGGAGSLGMSVVGIVAVAGLFAVMRGLAGRAQAKHASENGHTAHAKADTAGVVLLVSSTALRFFVSASFITFLPNLITARGDSLIVAGWVVTSFLVSTAVGQFAGGLLSDRLGALRVSIASLLLSMPLLLGFLASGGPIALVWLLLGSFLLSMQNAPGVAMVQAMLPRNLGMALGLMNGVAFGLGSALVACIGVLVTHYGPAAALAQVTLVPLLSVAALAIVGMRTARLKRSQAV